MQSIPIYKICTLGFGMILALASLGVLSGQEKSDDCPQTVDTGCELQLAVDPGKESEAKAPAMQTKKITAEQWQKCKKYVSEYGLKVAGWTSPNHKGDCSQKLTPQSNYQPFKWGNISCDQGHGICSQSYFLRERIMGQDAIQRWGHRSCTANLRIKYLKLVFTHTSRYFQAIPGQRARPDSRARLYQAQADCSQF